jgi:hypothetical protein
MLSSKSSLEKKMAAADVLKMIKDTLEARNIM